MSEVVIGDCVLFGFVWLWSPIDQEPRLQKESNRIEPAASEDLLLLDSKYCHAEPVRELRLCACHVCEQQLRNSYVAT